MSDTEPAHPATPLDYESILAPATPAPLTRVELLARVLPLFCWLCFAIAGVPGDYVYVPLPKKIILTSGTLALLFAASMTTRSGMSSGQSYVVLCWLMLTMTALAIWFWN